MKEVELKLISELMKNCRRSDRQLAKAIGVSQPTVSRTIRKLEKEGYIEEYAAIPNPSKLGFEIMALTFLKLEKAIPHGEIEETRKKAAERLAEGSFTARSFEIIMLQRGAGLGYDAVVISYHRRYSDYAEFLNRFYQYKFLDTRRLDSFLINLNDKINYRPLTFKALARRILEAKEG